MRPLRAQVLPVQDLSLVLRGQMFALLCGQFEGADAQVFAQDLSEKDRVILLFDAQDTLQGFSTLRIWREPTAQGHATLIFSGDTVVAKEAWGTPALAAAWLSAALQVREASPQEPVYWLLLSSGFRTYRFLPAFYHRFWPRYDQPTPDPIAQLMEQVAQRSYGPLYQDGVVRLPQGTRVRPEVARLTPGRLQNPHVAFFAQRNPGHSEGHELVCLTEVDPQNFTPAAARVLRRLSAQSASI